MTLQTRLQAYPKNGTIAVANGDRLVYDVPDSNIVNVSSADQSFTIRLDDTYDLIGKNNKRYKFGDISFKRVEIINDSGATLNVQVEIGAGEVESDDVSITGTLKTEAQGHSTLTTTADDSIAATSTEQVLAINLDRKEALIGNLSANGSNIRVGDANTGAARGVELAPGQTITLTTTAAISVYNSGAAAQSVSILEVE